LQVKEFLKKGWENCNEDQEDKQFFNKFKGPHDKKEAPIFLVGIDSMIKEKRKREGVDSWHNSDKDPIFIRKFWTKLFSCLGTQLAHYSYFHPQYSG
jgi:hypothetical protein